MRAAVCAPSIAGRARFLAAIAQDPNNALPDNPCLEETWKTLAGKWLLTSKGSEWPVRAAHARLQARCGWRPGITAVGPGIPPHPKIETEFGGNNLKLKLKSTEKSSTLAARGDIITGHYSSAWSSGTLVRSVWSLARR
jgi:hypothetical protein